MSSARGHQRERDVRKLLEAEGWLVVRAAGSLGVGDLVALKAGERPMLVEVKSTAGGPYERFGPADRASLAAAAAQGGANAWLAYWPPRGELRWIFGTSWPHRLAAAAQVFPLPPREAAVLAEFFRLLDARILEEDD